MRSAKRRSLVYAYSSSNFLFSFVVIKITTPIEFLLRSLSLSLSFSLRRVFFFLPIATAMTFFSLHWHLHESEFLTNPIRFGNSVRRRPGEGIHDRAALESEQTPLLRAGLLIIELESQALRLCGSIALIGDVRILLCSGICPSSGNERRPPSAVFTGRVKRKREGSAVIRCRSENDR